MLSCCGYAMKLSDLPIIQIPFLDVSSDPLDVLVLGLALRMKHLSRSNTQFIELITDKQFCLQIGNDSGMARQILVDHGSIRSVAGQAQQPDFILQFANSDLGVKTLLQGDAAALMTGMQNGSIQMQGDFALLVWFNQVATLIPPQIPEPIKAQVRGLAQRIKDKLR